MQTTYSNEVVLSLVASPLKHLCGKALSKQVATLLQSVFKLLEFARPQSLEP
jgi:hypothetical protein